MKKVSFSILILTAILGLSSIPVAFAAGEAAPGTTGGKYGFVDVAKVFDEYQKTKENDRNLQDSGKKKEEERDAFVRDIRQMKDELTLLSDDAKAKKQDALTSKIKQLEEFDRDTRQALGEQRNAVVREIFKDIDEAVQAISQQRGLDLVFNDRALLYHSGNLDLTREVTDQLNKNFKPKGGKKK